MINTIMHLRNPSYACSPIGASRDLKFAAVQANQPGRALEQFAFAVILSDWFYNKSDFYSISAVVGSFVIFSNCIVPLSLFSQTHQLPNLDYIIHNVNLIYHPCQLLVPEAPQTERFPTTADNLERPVGSVLRGQGPA